MFKKLVITLLLVPALLQSCLKPEVGISRGENNLTLLIYMPWSTNLTGYFEDNLEGMERSIRNDGILRNARIVVFFMSSRSEGTLFELDYRKSRNRRTTLQTYRDPAVNSSDWISSVIEDVKTHAPSHRYSMVVSGHGLAWIPVGAYWGRSMAGEREKDYWEYEGVPLTRYFGAQEYDYQTDITTLAEGISKAGIRMEYILFDNCYMSAVEVAFDLKDVCNHIIASPTEVNANGFPYRNIGKHLVGKIDYGGICRGFMSYYEKSSRPYATIALIKCSEMDALAAVMKEINTRFTFDESLLPDLQPMDGYSPVIFFDCADYVSKLCSDQELFSRFERQLELTVPSNMKRHTPSYYAMGAGYVDINTYSGITISDPSRSVKAASKTRTAWYKATH